MQIYLLFYLLPCSKAIFEIGREVDPHEYNMHV